jgi:pre-mRNA-splicing factor ATP-dependent RNA helicase DHX38/PRP16
LVRDTREKRDRMKAQTKFWEVAGSRVGDIMGLKKEKEVVDDAADDDGDVDYKKAAQYGASMNKQQAAVSHFAKSKTKKEQVLFASQASIEIRCVSSPYRSSQLLYIYV